MAAPKSIQTLAHLLGDVDSRLLGAAVSALEEALDEKEVVDALVADIEKRSVELLDLIGAGQADDTASVRGAMNDFLTQEEQVFKKLVLQGVDTRQNTFSTLLDEALQLAGTPDVWALKWETAEGILRQSPPTGMMEKFGIDSVDDLLGRFDVKEIFAALRFTETNEWMHQTFDTAYDDISPDDFEERGLEPIVLSGNWREVAREFVEKKHHNISHLKEFGIVFMIPIALEEEPGRMLRAFTLLLHYMHEVPFYSRLFRRAAEEENFSERFISLLRGDVPDGTEDPLRWLIVQRYLAKEDSDDPRLGLPHVNPEALHWGHAAEDLVLFGERFDELRIGKWGRSSYVGIPRTGSPAQSLDLIDSIMALVDGTEYAYHYHEALWNELLARFIGQEALQSVIVDNIVDGSVGVDDLQRYTTAS